MSHKSNKPQVEWVSADGSSDKRQLLVRLPFMVWPASAKSEQERRDLAHRDFGMISMFVRKDLARQGVVAVPTFDSIMSQLVVTCEADHARLCGFITASERIAEADIDIVLIALKQECIGNLPARWLNGAGVQPELFEDDCGTACRKADFGRPVQRRSSNRQQSNRVIFTPTKVAPAQPLIIHVAI